MASGKSAGRPLSVRIARTHQRERPAKNQAMKPARGLQRLVPPRLGLKGRASGGKPSRDQSRDPFRLRDRRADSAVPGIDLARIRKEEAGPGASMSWNFSKKSE